METPFNDGFETGSAFDNVNIPKRPREIANINFIFFCVTNQLKNFEPKKHKIKNKMCIHVYIMI